MNFFFVFLFGRFLVVIKVNVFFVFLGIVEFGMDVKLFDVLLGLLDNRVEFVVSLGADVEGKVGIFFFFFFVTCYVEVLFFIVLVFFVFLLEGR